MTFPTVASVTEFIGTGNTTHEGNFPATVNAGDLLIIQVAADGSGNTITLNETGWATLNSAASHSHASGYFWKSAVGDEDGGTFTVDLGSSDEIVTHCIRITGWHGTTAPEISTVVGADDDSAPNAPNYTVTGWTGSAEDTLWFAAVTADGLKTVSAYPTNCADNRNEVQNVTFGASAYLASAESKTDAFNPDAFTLSGADGTRSFTLAVRPASVTNTTIIIPTGPWY